MEKRSTSFFRIDDQVFISMAILAAVSLLVLAFRIGDKDSCQSVKFAFSGVGFTQESPVVFTAEAVNGKKYEWDFGDNTKQVDTDATTTHTYKNAGKYTVILTVNDDCVAAQNISIKEARAIANNEAGATISGPDSAAVGKPVTFYDRTPNATGWEWFFGESGTLDAVSKDWSYTYKTPGPKTVILKVRVKDSITLMVRETIFIKANVVSNKAVIPGGGKRRPGMNPMLNDRPMNDPLKLPEEPVAATNAIPTAPAISNAEMSAALEGVVTGSKGTDYFSQYLCGELNMNIFFNGKEMTFTQMCEKLKGIRKLKRIHRPSVGLTKDGNSGCIKTMNVTVKSRSLLDRIF